MIQCKYCGFINKKKYILISVFVGILLFLSFLYYKKTLFIKNNASYDKIYVISLDGSSRWPDTEKRLLDAGLEFSKFPAVAAKDLLITNLDNNETIFGAEALEKQIPIKKYTWYLIKCAQDRNSGNGLIFYTRRNLNVQEAALICSNYLVWQDAIKNKYNNIVIFEDDAIPIGKDFHVWLENYVKNLPKNYDLAFLWNGFTMPPKRVPINNYIAAFPDDYGAGNGTLGMVYSRQCIEKLLKFKFITAELDLFLMDNRKIKSNLYGTLDIYASYNDRLIHPPLTEGQSKIFRYIQDKDR